MKIKRKTERRTFVFCLLLFFLSGCHLFNEGESKLKAYCPDLKIKLSGVGHWLDGSRDVYMLSYNKEFQKRVQAYFTDKNNHFSEEKDSNLFDVEIGDIRVMDKSDNIVGKTINTPKAKVEVMFNQTTRRIIFVEYSRN